MASPMAWAAEAQAVEMAVLGPQTPKWIEMLPAAAVGDHFRDDERADLVRSAVAIAAVLFLEFAEAADAAAEDDAAAIGVFAG